jgi:nicotinate-nucleotide adenylyltransferase
MRPAMISDIRPARPARIGLFGGTFNPIHLAHLRAAQEVGEAFDLDRVLFVPAYAPPLKRRELADPQRRLEMVRMAVSQNPAFEVSDVEFRQGASYSLHTVRAVREDFSKNVETFFILGMDAFLDIDKWHMPEELVRETHFIVVLRPGWVIADVLKSPYLENSARQTVLNAALENKSTLSLTLTGGKNLHVLKITHMDVSATRIRQLLRDGKSVKYLLPENVESFIINNKLYRNDPNNADPNNIENVDPIT